MKDGPTTYYALLQVDPAAEPEVIESAYRRLARKYHPDVNPAPEAHRRMRAINEAYRVLSQPALRAAYDQELRRRGVLRGDSGSSASAVSRVRTRACADPVSVGWYVREVAGLRGEASRALADWAVIWAEALEAWLTGDSRGRQRGREAGQRCLEALSRCLERWEKLPPAPPAARLGEVGAALLKLELAMVRGALTVLESDDSALLDPLAGLADRIAQLAHTAAAEAVQLGGAPDGR